MSPSLLRPRATGFHPEAQGWRNRVIANGGTVSGSTLNAVSKFCRDIDAAGIRNRFYRLNLFCGNNLNACLVPLYRGTSLGGSQLGGSTDTNANFVSGDYTETGASGGLSRAVGNNSKRLTLNLTPNQMPQLLTVHFGCGVSTGNPAPVGSLMFTYPFPVLTNSYYCSWYADTGANASFILTANHTDSGPQYIVEDRGRVLAVRYGETDARTFQNGTQTGTNATPAGTRSGHDVPWGVFGSTTTALRMHYYTIGDQMSAAQITAFDQALSAFLTSLSRV